MSVQNVVDIRSRVPSVFRKGGFYLQNLTVLLWTYLEAAKTEINDADLASAALRIRNSVLGQTTESQIRAAARAYTSEMKKTGWVPLYSQPGALFVAVSNWTKA